MHLQTERCPRRSEGVERRCPCPAVGGEDRDVVHPPDEAGTRRSQRVIPGREDDIGEHRGRDRPDGEPLDAGIQECAEPRPDLSMPSSGAPIADNRCSTTSEAMDA